MNRDRVCAKGEQQRTETKHLCFHWQFDDSQGKQHCSSVQKSYCFRPPVMKRSEREERVY